MPALRIGLTGGIGSGKSTVAKIFQALGIPVFDADSEAKKIMNTDPSLKQALIQTFGPDTYNAEGLDRKYLARIVFSAPYQLELLNSLVHPATIRASEQWMEAQTAPYTIKEAALLFESGTAANLDYIIGVYTPLNLRLQRVARRDQASYEDIRKRMDNQLNEEMKMKLCDFVILNDESISLVEQVLGLHKKFLSLSNK